MSGENTQSEIQRSYILGKVASATNGLRNITIIGSSPVTITKTVDNADTESGTLNISVENATTNEAGLMTSSDKTKLDGIATGATANIGTITGITMNGTSKGTSGVVDLGTVITSHQDISGKQNKLAVTGSATKGVYISSEGIVSPMTYELNKTVPSDAKFTDTWTAMSGATSSANGTAGYVPAPPTDGYNTKYLRADGTWTVPPDNNTTYTFTNQGATLAWSTTSTIATVGGVDIKVTMPANPNTNTWRGIQDNLTSSSNTTESLSAKQGYLLANGSARDSTKVPLAGGTMTGNLTLSGGAGIYYTGTKSTGRLIRFLDNTNDAYGNGISIGGGGPTIIGGGEAADTVVADTTNYPTSSGQESLILANDSDIIFLSNVQSGTSSAKKMTFNTVGNLLLPADPTANLAATTKQYVDNTTVPKVGPGALTSCNGGGVYLYCHIATITVTTSSSYIYRPIVFIISGKDRMYSHVQVMFSSKGGTKITLSKFITDNCADFYIKQASSEIWNLYGQFKDTEGSYVLHQVTGAGAATSISLPMETLSALPDGCIQVTGISDGYIRTGQSRGSTLGERATCEGSGTTASGYASHAEGAGTAATGDYSHAEGSNTTASGYTSHTEGGYTTASGEYSHAEGVRTTASGKASHARGHYTIASADYQTAIGVYNVENTINTNAWFIVGKGTNSARANAFRVGSSGVWGAGAYNSSGADYAEMFEWADGNTENEDRVGRFVTLESSKIRLATSEDDYILGIVSGNPTVLGDVYDDQYKGMYEYDVYDRPLWEDVEVPAETRKETDPETGEEKEIIVIPAHVEHRQKLNPNYDSSKKYKPRSERPEWSPVGLIGKLVCNDDGTSEVNGYVKVSNNKGIATHSETRTRYRVMERLDDTHIRIYISPSL